MFRAVAPTLASTLFPTPAIPRALRSVLLVLAGSFLVALSARITIPLWPVPITGQTFGVLIVGMALGSRLGAAAMAAYMLEGLAGLPVFAGGAGGMAILTAPSFGYIIGYVPAAALVGWLAEQGWDRSFGRTAFAMLLGNVALYVPGLIWLGWIMATVDAAWAAEAITTHGNLLVAVLMAGIVPFLIGDAVKLLLAAAAMPLAWKIVRR